MHSIDTIEKFELLCKWIQDNSWRILGPSVPSYKTVTRWTKRFSEGREGVNDHPRSPSLLSPFTGENIQLLRQVISNDLHSTYVEITAEASLPRGTIERLIHSCLKMKKVISRWVPHQLTNEQRVKLWRENLARFQNGSWWWCDIIAGDEA